MLDEYAQYPPVADVDDEASRLVNAKTADTQYNPYERRRVWYRAWPWLIHGVLVLLSVSVLLWAWLMRITIDQCTQRLSTFSPALAAVEYRVVTFNGSLEHPSVYRGPPSAALDAAWEEISTGAKLTCIPESDLRKLGKTDRPSIVKLDGEAGGGILVEFEISHQLHCLNMLRQHTYFDYYSQFDEDYQVDPDFYRVHLDHCIEILRQLIMCTGDVGLITYDWVKGWNRPFPDFSTRHVCRDTSKLFEYIKQAPHVSASHIYRAGDVIDLPKPA